MFLVCYVILKDHLSKRYSDFIGRSLLKLVTILPGLVVIGTAMKEMQWF